MDSNQHDHRKGHKNHYRTLGLMMLASFVAMYLLMFINMDRPDHFSITLKRIHMATCMIGVMAIIMLPYMLPGMLNNSQDIADLRIPPSDSLEKLTGGLKSCYSIRTNRQWRIIFKWSKGNTNNFEIIDYH